MKSTLLLSGAVGRLGSAAQRVKQAACVLACASALGACAEPVTTSRQTVTVDGNPLQVSSGTWSEGYFVSVDNVSNTWKGRLKGGKEKWNARRDLLQMQMRNEVTRICGTWFVAPHRGPVYRMLDNDETMGGMAPVLGVSASMIAYLAAEAATKDENIPTGVYFEFECPPLRG